VVKELSWRRDHLHLLGGCVGVNSKFHAGGLLDRVRQSHCIGGINIVFTGLY